VMTWGKAVPVLSVSVIFDALRIFFEWFVLFGPALGAVVCTAGVNSAIGTSVSGVGGKIVTAGCTAVAGVLGFFGAGPIEAFGIVMAMAVGFLGWLVVGGILLGTNSRIFKENALWFIGSLLVSEIPFVGSIPAITISVWRMYGRQIKMEKAALAKWKKEGAAAQLQERNQQIAQAQMMKIRDAQVQQAQFEEQEAANYESTEKVREAA